MCGQQHALAVCLVSMEVKVSSSSYLSVNSVSFIYFLVKINPMAFTGDKVLENSASKEGVIIF